MPGTAKDFAAAVAKDAVDEDVLDENEVDFVWVVRGFLTYHFPIHHGWRSAEEIPLAVFRNCLKLMCAVRCLNKLLELH